MLLPPFYRAECLSSIFLGFLSLPVTALKKCVSPNWFSSSLPIYSNPLIAKAGKTYSSDSCSCWPVGKRWVSRSWGVWNQDFLLRPGAGAPLSLLYHSVVSPPILESKKKKNVNQTYAHQITSFLASDLKKEVNNLDKSYKRRGKPRIWNVLLYFENRKLWSLERKIPQKKKKKKETTRSVFKDCRSGWGLLSCLSSRKLGFLWILSKLISWLLNSHHFSCP